MIEQRGWRQREATFQLNLFYTKIVPRRFESFPTDVVLNSQAPTKARCVIQEVDQKGILTMDNTKRQGWMLVNRYFLCKSGEKSSYHILLQYLKARLLWQLIFSSFGVAWVLHSSIKATLLSWQGHFTRKKRNQAWKVILLRLFWIIWKKRNRRDLKMLRYRINNVYFSFMCNYLKWTKGGLKVGCMSMLDFVNWLDCKYWKEVFFVFLSSCSLLCSTLTHLVYFMQPFLVFFNILIICLSNKKNSTTQERCQVYLTTFLYYHQSSLSL